MALNWTGSCGQYHAFERGVDGEYRHVHIIKSGDSYVIQSNHFLDGRFTFSRECRRKTLLSAKKVAETLFGEAK